MINYAFEHIHDFSVLEDKYFEMEPERKKVQFLLGSDEFAYKSLLYFFVVKNTQML